MADSNPFTVVESHFIDAKFYFGPTLVEEVQLMSSLLEEKKNKSNGAEKRKAQKIIHVPIPKKKVANENKIKECSNKLPHKARILHYIPLTKRKEGQSSFAKDEDEAIKGLKNLTHPVASLITPKFSKPSLKGFVKQSKS